MSTKTSIFFFYTDASPQPSTRSNTCDLEMVLKRLQKDRQMAAPSPWRNEGCGERLGRGGGMRGGVGGQNESGFATE